jgi:hypothetical protein
MIRHNSASASKNAKRAEHLKASTTITCFAAAALIASAQGRDVSGQVFIVTKAHESVKLGLVPISVYARDAIKSSIEAVDTALKSERDEAKDQLSVISEAQKSASRLQDQLWREVRSSSYDKQRSAAWSRASSLEMDILSRETMASRRTSFLFGSTPYFRELNEHHRPVATTKTDADGKFTVTVPNDGEFAIVAYSERQTPKGSENYYWCVPAADHVDLSNDNFTRATTGASLLHVIGSDDNADSTVTKAKLQQKLSDIKTKYADIFAAIQANTPPVAKAPARLVTLTQDVSVQLPYGTVTLPAGTRLEFVSSDSSEVHIRYMNTEQAIPISAVDVR